MSWSTGICSYFEGKLWSIEQIVETFFPEHINRWLRKSHRKELEIRQDWPSVQKKWWRALCSPVFAVNIKKQFVLDQQRSCAQTIKRKTELLLPVSRKLMTLSKTGNGKNLTKWIKSRQSQTTSKKLIKIPKGLKIFQSFHKLSLVTLHLPSETGQPYWKTRQKRIEISWPGEKQHQA